MLPVAIVALSTPGLVFAPLVPGPTPSARPRVATTLTFRERGLAVSGTACDTTPWAVAVGIKGENCHSPGNSMAAISFAEPAGPHVFAVGAPSGMFASPSCGSVMVSKHVQTVEVSFSPSPRLRAGKAGALIVCAPGLPHGTDPAFTLTPAGSPLSTGVPQLLTSSPLLRYGIAPGDYELTATVACQAGHCYRPVTESSALVVQAGQATATAIQYLVEPAGILRVRVTGLPDGAQARIDVKPVGATDYLGYAGTVSGSRTLSLLPGSYNVIGVDYCARAGSCYAVRTGDPLVTVDATTKSPLTVSYGTLDTSPESAQAVGSGTQLGSAITQLETASGNPPLPTTTCLEVTGASASPNLQPCGGPSGEAQDIATYLAAQAVLGLIPCVGLGAKAGSTIQSLIAGTTVLPGESEVEMQDGPDVNLISDVRFGEDVTDTTVDLASTVADGTCVTTSVGPQVIITVVGFGVGLVVSLVQPAAYTYRFSPVPLATGGQQTILSVTSSYSQNESQVFCSEAYDETRSNYCLQSTGELVNPVSLNMCANTGAVPGAVVALSVFASDQPGTLFYDAFGRTVPPAGSFQVGSTPVEHGTQIVTGLCGTVAITYQPGSSPTSGQVCQWNSPMTSTTILSTASCGLGPETLNYDDLLAFDPLKLASPLYDYHRYQGTGTTTSSTTSTTSTTTPQGPPTDMTLPIIADEQSNNPPVDGDTLLASVGTWTGSPTGYSYQWQDCNGGTCADIAGANSSTYVLGDNDVGGAVDVAVTAENAAGNSSPAVSDQTETVQPGLPSSPGTSSVGTCTFATSGTSSLVSGEPYPSAIDPNSNAYSCIVAVNNNGGQVATSTADWDVTISFAPPMAMGGVTYQHGLAVVVQTDTNSIPDSGNTDTVIYNISRSGTFSATVGVDDATTNQGGDLWGSETYSTSPDMDVAFSLNGSVVAQESFSALGQSAPVSFPVSAGAQLSIAVSNVDAEARGAESEPGQVDVVNPLIS